MSDTHPNAFRAEANELRTQGNQLLDAAKALDAQADELEGKTPVTPVNELPAGGETFDPAKEPQTSDQQTEDEKKGAKK